MKIALIAISGVRAHNPELTALGLTLPGFVERSRVVASLPSLGLLTLAGLTPPSIEMRYVEVPDPEQVAGLPEECDVAAISSYSAQIFEAYELADRYRAAGTKVILGGLHVTALPEEALKHADAIALGEGEVVWPEIVDDLLSGAGQLRSVYDGRGCSFDLQCAPMPAYELLDIERYNRLTVQTQRGCPFRCEFCAASIQISPKFKQKPVEKIVAEVQRIRSLWERPFIEFADDNTFVNKTHSKRLLRALRGEQIRWFTETDISVADDAELLGLMRDSGCAQVLIGLESTAFSALDGLELHSNWKAHQLDRYAEAVDRIQGHGITVNGCFILGLDGSGLDSLDEILRFVHDSGLYEVQITVQTAFPGTPLYSRLQREGRIVREGAWELCTLFDVNFHPAKMTVAELEAGLRELGKRLYSEESVQHRRALFLCAPARTFGSGAVDKRRFTTNRNLSRILFLIAGLYDGLLGAAFLFFGESLFEMLKVTPPNHPGYIRFPALILIIFGALFFQIAADPVRNRGLIWYGVALKASYSGVVFWYQTHGGLPHFWVTFAWFDIAFLILFLLALRTPKPA